MNDNIFIQANETEESMMHPYIDRLKEELDKNPPCYGYKNANSLLDMLYMWYVE